MPHAIMDMQLVDQMNTGSDTSSQASDLDPETQSTWVQGDGDDEDQENTGGNEDPDATQPVPHGWDGQQDDASGDRSLPPHLKEISSLASWTVSTHKPGCGVQALRHPSPNSFWQSDGPQPHTLNIHFFKLVSIAHMRVYIDHELDESYTPIKMEFWAGTGHHDLQHVCEINPHQPKGWLDVDLRNAGGPPALRDDEVMPDGIWGSLDASAFGDGEQGRAALMAARMSARRWQRIGTGPTLRCFLVQLRIIENHQNGKDTHLRGLQIFARDESYVYSRPRPDPLVRTLPSIAELGLANYQRNRNTAAASIGAGNGGAVGHSMREPDWMGELEMNLGEHELR